MKAEKVYIQHLMEKFMGNATSVDEERVLKEYFSTHDDIPEDWDAYAILFRGFNQNSFVATKKPKSIYPWLAAVAASVICVFILYIYDNSHEELAVTELVSDTIKVQMPLQEMKSDNTKLLATPVDTKKNLVKKNQFIPPRHQISDNLELQTSSEIDEFPDAQTMQEYIANNFMRLDERILLEESDDIINMSQNSYIEHSEYLNGLGQIVNIENYDF